MKLRLLTTILIFVIAVGMMPVLNGTDESFAESESAIYKDSMLNAPSTRYDNDIALLSAELSLATYGSDGGKYSTSIDNMLRGFGCDYVTSQSYGGAKAFTVAEKVYQSENGGANKVLFIVAQGSTVGEEFIKDATAWADASCKEYTAYDYMNDFANTIMHVVKGVCRQSNKYKVIVTGHSLGGAAANLVAAQIADEINTEKEDVFCYTFGAINSIARDEPVESGYENIHNVYNYYDTFSNDQYGFLMVNGAGGKYGKFGHIDMYKKAHAGRSIEHDMDLYRDDVKAGIVTCNNNKSVAVADISGIPVYTTYTGKEIKPTPKVSYYGKKLKKGVDYKVSYKNNISVGVASALIKGIGKYKGTATVPFEIIPKGSSVKSVTAADNAAIITWAKQSAKMKKSRIGGYEIQVSADPEFKENVITDKISGYSNTSAEITGLNPTTTYYARVRTFMPVTGINIYSKWSAKKAFNTDRADTFFRDMLTEFRCDINDSGGSYDGTIGAIVKYNYNKQGLVDTVTGKALFDNRKWYSYKGSKLKYTFYDSGYVKSIKVYSYIYKKKHWVQEKKPWIQVEMNEYGVPAKFMWGSSYPTIVYCEPVYYNGTHNLKRLNLTWEDGDDEYHTTFQKSLLFDKEGYYVGTRDDSADREDVTYKGSGQRDTYSFEGYYWDEDYYGNSYQTNNKYGVTGTYRYTYGNDGKVKTRIFDGYDYSYDGGDSENNYYSWEYITTRKWKRMKVSDRNLRSARYATEIIDLFWDEGLLAHDLPASFVYEWK